MWIKFVSVIRTGYEAVLFNARTAVVFEGATNRLKRTIAHCK